MTIQGDGFFILVTKSPYVGSDEEYEYRVAYCKDISVIYGNYDDYTYTWNPDRDGLWNTFKACFFSSKERVARLEAEKMSKLHGSETECGILFIRSFRKRTWDELINA